MSFTTLIDVTALRRLLPGGDASPGADPLPGADALPRAGSAAVVLLDCRFDLTTPGAGREAYWRAHIPGARYADLNEDLAGPVSADSGRHPLPEPAVLARRFAAFGIGPGVQVVAYDQANGSFAARAWWLLRWLGHRQVAVLDGGFNAWMAGRGELQSGEPPSDPVPGTPGSMPHVSPPDRADRTQGFMPPINAGAVVSTGEVLRALSDPSRLLVDARAAERYAGKVEPIDPVAGHVAGAVNHPFADNLREDGRFLAPIELRRRWLERLGGKAPENTILMCGSGVTACHDLLALELAGLPGAKLYAGSWSEWIRDPRRPVTRGSAP